MQCLRRTIWWSVIATIVACFSVPASAVETVTIDGIELIDRTRVGRTTYNYTYRVTATNTAPVALDEVILYLSQTSPDPDPDQDAGAGNQKFDPGSGTYTPTDPSAPATPTGSTLLDDTVIIGTMAAGETIVSDDVIVLQQDRQFELDTESLFWEVGFAATVRLSGVVRDRPIEFAAVEVTVNRSDSGRPIIDSGRPIIERFTTTADGDGNYSVDANFYTADDFVSVNGDGVDDLDFVALVSIAGSAGSLLTDATSIGDSSTGRSVPTISIDGADANALNVTHVSTALAVLATAANGGVEFTNDEDLAAAQAQVNNEELLIAAAVLKSVIDFSDIALPGGVTTTLDLLQDDTVFNDFLVVLQDEFPMELELAIEETIEDISVGYVAEDLPAKMYLTIVRENPLISDAHVFTFDPAGTGTHIDFNGETTDADWTVNPAGEIIVTLNNPPQQEFFETLEVPPDSGTFVSVRVLSSFSEFRIARIAVGVETDQVLLGSTLVRTFPDEPLLPTETLVTLPGPQNARLAFDETVLVPYTASELAGQVREIQYFHTDNNSVGLINAARGADLLTFNADGSGVTERRGFAFNWSIDTAGILTFTFDNGDSNALARYAQIDGGVVDLGVMVGRYDTEVRAVDNLSVRPDPVTEFTETDLLERKFRNGRSVVEGSSPGTPGFGSRFDINFLADGEGCRDNGFSVAPFDWILSVDGYMEFQRFAGDPPFLFRQRSWRPIAVVPGVLGPRYWVLENLDLDFTAPGFPTDPRVTPGRVNFYEYIKDIGDNTPPVAVADSVTTMPGTPVFIDIFSNDTDAEGDDILITAWSGTALGGTVTERIASTGNSIDGLIYTPPPGLSGVTDSFTYSIADGSCAFGTPDEGTVEIFIEADDSPAVRYETVLDLAEPTIDGITQIIFNWETFVCDVSTTDQFFYYALSLYEGANLVYFDTVIEDGIVQPLGSETRDMPFWDFDLDTMTLFQFNTGIDVVIGNPGATGVNYLVIDDDSPARTPGKSGGDPIGVGIVRIDKYEDGLFLASESLGFSQSTIIEESSCFTRQDNPIGDDAGMNKTNARSIKRVQDASPVSGSRPKGQ